MVQPVQNDICSSLESMLIGWRRQFMRRGFVQITPDTVADGETEVTLPSGRVARLSQLLQVRPPGG